MSYVRSSGYRLKDPDDDAALQVVIGDLQRLSLGLYRGTPNAAYNLTDQAATNLGDSSGQSPDIPTTPTTPTTPTLGFRVTSTAFVLADNTTTAISDWSTTATACFSTVGGALTATTFTVATAGYYFLGAGSQIQVSSSSSITAQVNFSIYKNGSTLSPTIGDYIQGVNDGTSSNTKFVTRYATITHSTVLSLAAGDTVDLRAYATCQNFSVAAAWSNWSMYLLESA